MADDQQTRADDPTPAEAAKAARKPDDDTIDRERLIAESQAYFGQPPHVVAGALANIAKKKLTLKEVDAATKAFLKMEVN
jgi:hypothetical protein